MNNQTRIVNFLYYGLITQEDMRYLIGYINLNTDDFKLILRWKIKDWNEYFDYKHNENIFKHNQLYNKMMKCEEEENEEN